MLLLGAGRGRRGDRIFARMTAPGRQLIAYEMMFAAARPVAMILAVPTPPNSADDAVRFISLAH